MKQWLCPCKSMKHCFCQLRRLKHTFSRLQYRQNGVGCGAWHHARGRELRVDLRDLDVLELLEVRREGLGRPALLGEVHLASHSHRSASPSVSPKEQIRTSLGKQRSTRGLYFLCDVVRAESYGVVEGSKVRRRAKSEPNAIRAPQSVPNTPQSAPKCVQHSSWLRRLTLPRQGHLLQPRPTNTLK